MPLIEHTNKLERTRTSPNESNRNSFMSSREPCVRGTGGQSIVVMVAIITLLILFPVGLFSYEVNRMEVCRQQLRAACESAALAAGVTLASQDSLDTAQAQRQAIQTALTTFRDNSVVGVSLKGTTLTSDTSDSPKPEESTLCVELLDPNEGNQPVAIGDPKGKVVRVTAAFGLKPSFGPFVGVGSAPLRSTNSSGVPDLDVVLCFDVSGSMDDQTPVTFVKRVWKGDAATGRIEYNLATASGLEAKGRIYDVIGPVPSGTRVNALSPQYLDLADTDVRRPLTFSETGGATRGLRGTSNTGALPGNCPPDTASVGNAQTFTDMVVNLDGKLGFGGITADGYEFPSIAVVVEAARGNLDDAGVFASSGAGRSLPSNITPRPGYRAKYLQLAGSLVSPLGEAQRAAFEFFTIMNTNTKGHFALVAFSDNAGVSPASSYNDWNVSSRYSAGGASDFPIPDIVLNPDTGATNYSEIEKVLPTTRATTATNIGDALNTAVLQLRTRSRPGAKQAIVLFTDGMPTAGGPLHRDPEANTRLAASMAKSRGIPVYCIGLAQNPEIIPDEVRILNDTNSNPSSGGVSGIAGNGGKFFLVTDSRDLRRTFENIARHLVQLVN
jgi:hypothetical protein